MKWMQLIGLANIDVAFVRFQDTISKDVLIRTVKEHLGLMAQSIFPGPTDRSVLTLQDQHRSEDVWRGVADTVLSCRLHHHSLYLDWEIHDRVLRYVERAGFLGIHRLVGGGLEIDRPLLTALVERWRQETHTFHLTVGEATITLEDVAVILGLRVHGDLLLVEARVTGLH
ncbi:protein MAIN-LIKE 1-like [Beta vulgaris subsp. vulgaris]|uniref:protein MAIN-LIKE 1-like n=1 Tax=Beta vulgaris subsp. vulgaris TaxID=3555 RepID=UPI00254769C5|nr:protein MAIN-LIKE 1-like [Beta vulgaris subsp. vulgaris]